MKWNMLLSDLFETPTLERRQLLWQTKSFLCTCPRCMGPDYCRCLPCPSCQEIMPCDYKRTIPLRSNQGRAKDEDIQVDINELENGDWEAFWKCYRCHAEVDGDDAVALKRKESDIQQILQTVERDLMSRKNFDPSGGNTTSVCFNPGDLPDLVQECIDELSSTHYLSIKALRLLVVSSTTQAYVRIKQNVIRGISTPYFGLRGSSHIRMSVVAGIQLVLACECVAVSCRGCYLLNERTAGASTVVPPLFCGIFNTHHEPHYDRATPMRHIVENLVQLPLFLWPSNSMTMVYRYLPILRIKFRSSLRYEMEHATTTEKSNITIDLLDLMNDCWKRLQCKDCGTYWDASVETIIGAAGRG
jgi:uncharacterized CHY-type Zn-finger protein